MAREWRPHDADVGHRPGLRCRPDLEAVHLRQPSFPPAGAGSAAGAASMQRRKAWRRKSPPLQARPVSAIGPVFGEWITWR